MYTCSYVSEKINTEQDIENVTFCQVPVQKRDFYSSMRGEDFEIKANKEYETNVYDTISIPEKELSHFKLVKNMINIYKQVYFRKTEAEIEANGIINTIETLKTAAMLKRKIQWRDIYTIERLNFDIMYDQEKKFCSAKLKESSQKIKRLLRPIFKEYAYFQLDKKKKNEFFNFTSDSWGQEFHQMIKDAFGNKFFREIEDEIKKVKALRDEIWKNNIFLNIRASPRTDILTRTYLHTKREKGFIHDKFLVMEKRSLLNKSNNTKLFANQRKLAFMEMFSHNQKAKCIEERFEMRANAIILNESLEKFIICSDYIEGFKKSKQDLRYTENKRKITNKELDEKICSLLAKDCTFFQKEIQKIYYEFDLKIEILKLPFDIKFKVSNELENIKKKTLFDLSLLEKKAEQEKVLPSYEKESELMERLESGIKFIQELKKHCNSFDKSKKKNYYVNRLKSVETNNDYLALNIINSIIYAINLPFLREIKIKGIIGEMKKKFDKNFENIFSSLKNQKEFDYDKQLHSILCLADLEFDKPIEDKMLLDLVEQLVLQNLKKIENKFELTRFNDNKIKSKIKILKRNINAKSPIHVDENLYKMLDEISNIIYEILMNEILVVKKNMEDIPKASQDTKFHLLDFDVKIIQSTNSVDDNKDDQKGFENKKKVINCNFNENWHNKLPIYWNIIHENTTTSSHVISKDPLKGYVEHEKEKWYNFDLDLRELKEYEKECLVLLKIRFEKMFFWFFFYMRTYTFSVIDAYLGFKKIPQEKIDNLLVDYDIWEIFMDTAYLDLQNQSKYYSQTRLLIFGISYYHLKSNIESFLGNFLNELSLLLLNSVVSEDVKLGDN